MKKYTEKIPSRDGKTDINVVVWESNQPTAVLQLIHGMSEYIDRYDDFARFLTENGFNVIGHDHLGHGYSVSDERNYGFFADKNGDEIIIEDIHSVTEHGLFLFETISDPVQPGGLRCGNSWHRLDTCTLGKIG